jgi:tetratricopeptide (TPR) repeat protein
VSRIAIAALVVLAMGAVMGAAAGAEMGTAAGAETGTAVGAEMGAAAGAAVEAPEAACPDQPASDGEREFRAAWVAFTASVTGPAEARTPEARQQAHLDGIAHMEAAVKADPSKADSHISLAYMALTAGEYARARDAAARAVEVKGDDPLPYLLQGQAEAALARAGADEAGERIEAALKAFDEAARVDPKNSLPLMQGAGFAFEAGRSDLALPRAKQALGREGVVLPRLPVPFDLSADRTAAIDAWQSVQYGHWMTLLARCQNTARALLRSGEAKLGAEDAEGAEADFRAALGMGRMVGVCRPSLFVTANTAINMMEEAYARLQRVAEIQGSREAERWKGETGVLYIARGDLFNKLQNYVKGLQEKPPGSVEELLRLEAAAVEYALLGIGVTPPTAQEGPQAESSGSSVE